MLVACFGDDTAPDPGDPSSSTPSTVQNQPVGGSDPGDPAGPGFEPPDTAGNDSAMEPSQPTAGVGGTAGAPGTAGTGGATTGATGGTPPPPVGAADAGAAVALDAGDGGDAVCAELAACDAAAPCEAALHCIVVSSCGGPRCIDPADACMLECGTTECALLESYPEQIACN